MGDMRAGAREQRAILLRSPDAVRQQSAIIERAEFQQVGDRRASDADPCRSTEKRVSEQ